jgi:AcrR family transcriptional regulator
VLHASIVEILMKVKRESAVTAPAGRAARRTQAERSATTRESLLAAAKELFAAGGYAATGREQIAERAGVTRGALYHHFSSKQALFRAVVESLEREACAQIAVAAMRGNNALDQLRRGCGAFLDSALEPAFQRIVLVDGPAVLGWQAWREIDVDNGAALLREGLAHVLAPGSRGAGSLEVLTRLLLGALHEAAFLVANDPSPRRARRDVGRSVDDLISALLEAPKRAGTTS